MTRSIKALFVAVAIAGIATTASASPRQEITVTKILVRYGDLNLRNGVDAATLMGRLTRAATKVCVAPSPGPVHVRPGSEEFACRESALQNAVADVDHPVLTALYQSKREGAQLKLASR